MNQIASAAAIFCLLAGYGLSAAEFIWLEGENVQEKNFEEPAHARPANEQERDVLSGGEWLAFPNADNQQLMAKFSVSIPRTAIWNVWVRGHDAAVRSPITSILGETGGSFRWRFDAQPWNDTKQSPLPIDQQALDIRRGRYFVAAWCLLGGISLDQGTHELTIDASVPKGFLGIDCFCLTTGDFEPHGTCKPGETLSRTKDGWFPFEPYSDPFTSSVIDMSRTLHQPAGSRGAVKRQGDKLVLADTGETIRFWGVTACPDIWMAPKSTLDRLARQLAKRGVNLVRFHAAPFDETTPGLSTDGIHYFCSKLKENGVYYGFNWFCTAVSNYREEWGWEGFKERDHLLNLQFFYPPFQKRYRQWATTLLQSPNPYTGMTLAQDPATAYLELIDEDSLLWWAFNPEKNINPTALPFLERKWADWCAKRYGSPAKALDTWGDGNNPAQPDHPNEARLALYAAGQLVGNDWASDQRNERRATDQLRFMVETMRDFYQQTGDWLRKDLGYRGALLSTNWKTADPRVLDPLDKYADCVLDLTANNNYFECGTADSSFFPWSVGTVFRNRSFLKAPERVAMMSHITHNDHPHFFTEGGFTAPNRFRAEEQLLQACYPSLHGLDGMLPFVCQHNWNTTIASPWPIQTPVTMGQYPAMSLIYRMGYIDEAPAVVEETLELNDLYAFKGAPYRHDIQPDGNQAWAIPKDKKSASGLEANIDPLVFYVGRLTRQIGNAPASHRIDPKLTSCIDREKKTVRSITGQIKMDYGQGLLVLDAPKAQAVGGFLQAAGKQETSDLTVDGRNDYAVVVAVCLDDQALNRSKSILLQLMTEETNCHRELEPVDYQFKGEKKPGPSFKISRLGAGPILVKNIDGTIAFKREDAASLKVTTLDHNGYPKKTIGDATFITLQPDVIYYHIHK